MSRPEFPPESQRELWSAGLPVLARPVVMGVVNVTPDSFSDGGRFDTTDSAVTPSVLPSNTCLLCVTALPKDTTPSAAVLPTSVRASTRLGSACATVPPGVSCSGPCVIVPLSTVADWSGRLGYCAVAMNG